MGFRVNPAFPHILNPDPWIYLLDMAGTEGTRFKDPLNR